MGYTLCEFCGKEFDTNKLATTSFGGPYCFDCLELMIFEAEDAIERIENKTLERD